MPNIAAILYAEIDLVCILLLFYIMYKASQNIERRQSWQYYQTALTFIALFILSDLVWALIEYRILPHARLSSFLVNGMYYIFSIIGCGYWMYYTEEELEFTFSRPLRLLTRLPLFCMLVLLPVSYFNGCLYYFDENGKFVRGPLNVLVFIFPLCSLTVAFVHPLIRVFQKKYYLKRSHYLFLSCFALITLASCILQFFVMGTPLPCLGITAASLLVYLNNQQLLVSLDPLTRLNNRYHLMRYLSYKVEHPDKNHSLFLLIIDLDAFKQVNDTYGHVEGDQALIRVAGVLKKAAASFGCFVSRYGGDEFMIVYETDAETDVRNLCRFIHEELAASNQLAKTDYTLSVSIGYAKYADDIAYVPDFIALADRSLYEIKKEKKNIR